MQNWKDEVCIDKQNEVWKEDIFAVFINIPKRSMWAVAFSAISGCCAASLEGLSASGFQTCVRPATPWSSLCPGRIQLMTEKRWNGASFHSQTNSPLSSPQTHSWAFLPLSAVERQVSISALLRHLLGSTAYFWQLFGFLCWKNWIFFFVTLVSYKLEIKLVRGHSPQNFWLCGILCHQEATRISDKPGVVVPRQVSCPMQQQQSMCLAALNPDCPLSFLTSGDVFCPSALENRLLEGPTPGECVRHSVPHTKGSNNTSPPESWGRVWLG